MSIPHLVEAKELRKQGARINRAGMSQRVLILVNEFVKNDGSYKGAMKLAGRLKAITIAARCDEYWSEQVNKGYTKELFDITKFDALPVDEE